MDEAYTILGVSQDATDEEIKKAYRRLSKKYHPDANLNQPEYAERKFKEIQEAYKKIMDFRKYGASGGDFDFAKNLFLGVEILERALLVQDDRNVEPVFDV